MFSTLIGEEPSTKVMNLMYGLKVHGGLVSLHGRHFAARMKFVDVDGCARSRERNHERSQRRSITMVETHNFSEI